MKKTCPCDQRIPKAHNGNPNGPSPKISALPATVVSPPLPSALSSNFKDRGVCLADAMMKMIGAERFAEFKSASKRFRAGELTAEKYLRLFESNFGETGTVANELFHQLLEALPDPEKRRELQSMRGFSRSAECECLICAEPIKIAAVYQCNHVVCHICALRLRIKKPNTKTTSKQHDLCCVCKTASPLIVMVPLLPLDPDSATHFSVTFESKSAAPALLAAQLSQIRKTGYTELMRKCPLFDRVAKFATNDEIVLDHTKLMQGFICPKCANEDRLITFPNASKLQAHLEKDHQLYFCKLCVEFSPKFWFEHKLFTEDELQHHLTSEKSTEAPEDPSVIHPSCRFCETPFYDQSFLFVHMRECHETCTICEKRGHHPTFRNPQMLENHFRACHLFCEDPKCSLSIVERVFEDEVSLQSHIATYHSKGGVHIKNAARGIAPEFGFQYETQHNKRFQAPPTPTSTQPGATSPDDTFWEVASPAPSSASSSIGPSSPPASSSGRGSMIVENDFPALPASTRTKKGGKAKEKAPSQAQNPEPQIHPGLLFQRSAMRGPQNHSARISEIRF